MADEPLNKSEQPAGSPEAIHMPDIVPPAPEDPAIQSLADALRVSFRLLTVLMFIFLGLFLYTGIESIQPHQKGVCKVFGKVTDVKSEGFVLNWPFPVGQIEIVDMQEQRMTIDNFWMHETAKDKLRELSQRSRANKGLSPGFDGYLLTGDRNLIHIRMECTYRVQDALAYVSTVKDPKKLLRTVLCQAAIQAAAVRTADAMQIDPTGFRDDVLRDAQTQIDKLIPPGQERGHGIYITSVLVPADGKTWPLAAFTAYERANAAKSEKEKLINQAIGKAKEMAGVIGEKHFIELVGEPWKVGGQVEKKATGDVNLIGQYAKAYDKLAAAKSAGKSTPVTIAELEKRVEQLHDKIAITLTSATTGGDVSKIIAEAEADKTRTIQNARKRARQFTELHEKYLQAPELFLEKTWANVLDEILNAPTATKWMLSPGDKGMVIHLNRDPKTVQEIRNYLRRKAKEETGGK
ncbi:MAG: hypothetical protein K8S55_12210 [Phycisphaerae bacterium]|nr:hypothetical protein [Phycisphaerae bacterium]